MNLAHQNIVHKIIAAYYVFQWCVETVGLQDYNNAMAIISPALITEFSANI